ncbi:MAG TPA: PD-(D/E)XK nuclease family protein [Candidatus Paceibacterota bacterium]|nr:PD-(D/E)XK nuclease family protein [Candidatus Paceibacterota bacterium]
MPSKFSTIKLSRSSLKLFQDCPRCFWLDLHHKIRRPPGFPYTLSSAVDFLVKQEFDKYRREGTLPPVFARHNFQAKLFADPRLTAWRDNRQGVQYFDEDLNAILYGAVDDVLQMNDGSLAVVDYKSTGSREIRIYDDYQKQMEVYSWLVGRNGFQAHTEAYFVYYQVDKSGGGFANALPFIEQLKAVKVNTSWVPDVFEQAVMVARRDTPPEIETFCEHCKYVQDAGKFFVPAPVATPVKSSRSRKIASVEEPIIVME